MDGIFFDEGDNACGTNNINFTVKARDGSGNVSAASNPLSSSIDADKSGSAGHTPWFVSNFGADYLIESDRLYKSTANGFGWSWQQIGNVTPTVSGYTYSCSVPLSSLTGLTLSSSTKTVYQANGFAPFANTSAL